MSKTCCVALIVLAVVGTSAVSGEDRTRIVFSPPEEKVYGDRARTDFLADHPLSADGNLLTRIDGIGRQVARVSDRPQLRYRFYVLQGYEPQAYSLLDGTILLTEGLTALLTEDDELAFAIAHEISHVALRHHISKFRLLNAADSEASPVKLMLKTIVEHFGSDQEMEADRYGALYAVRAGFRFSSALRALEKMRDHPGHPDGDETHPDYAQRVKDLKRFKRQLELCLEAFEKGTNALRAGKTDEAIEMLEIFVSAFPQSVAGRVNLGATYLAKTRKTGGTPLGLAEELPILPDPGYVIRGHYSKLDLDDARDQFRLALDVDPQDVTALAGLAMVEIRLDDLQEARHLMDTALEIEPEDPALLLCSGNVYFMDDDVSSAKSQYAAALSIRPGWSAAKKNLALTHESLGEIDEARSLWEELVDDLRYGSEARQHVQDLGTEKLRRDDPAEAEGPS